MADCSQFASNMNVIPMLAEHPTMRVFMQNVVVNMHNVRDVIDQLYSEFLAFQKDTTNFRHFLKRKRSNQEYDLDVGGVGPREVSELETPSIPALKTQRTESDLSTAGKEEEQEMHVAEGEETSYHSSKREVWGVGKSGANLSRILHAGHFALKLLPADGRPQLILITDGTMKSNVNDNTFVRQFSDEDVTCHIIQVGSAKSFVPGRNFGFVPDNEILAFLTRATGGSLLYADECKQIARDQTPHEQSRAENLNDDNIHNLADSVLQYLPADNNDYSPPNMYHCKFLFRETTLVRSPDVYLQPNDRRDINQARDQSMEKQQAGQNFPWDPHSYPPQPPLRLLKYREYPLPAEFSHVIATRTREGFTLQSVSFDDGTGVKTLDTALRSLKAPDLSAIKKERIQIVMALHWQPNIVIEYRIRATWLPMVIGPSSQLKNDPMLLHSNIFGRSKAPRAEIFVRTDAEFAHMLQNWDIFRRRAQMMGVVTGATFFNDSYNAPVYAKTEKLRSYLIDIFEDDEVLKSLIGFNGKYLQSLASSLSSTVEHRSLEASQQRDAYLVSFHEFWDKLNASSTRARTRSWYDHDFIDLLIGNVSPYMSPKLTSAYNQEFISNVETEVNDALEIIRTALSRNMDFEGQDGTFVKVMNRMIMNVESKDDNALDYFSYSLGYPPSFYEVRVRREYGRLVSLRLLFFNMDVNARQRIKGQLMYLLKTSQETSSAYNYLCERPFSSLLMRDPKHFQDMMEPTVSRRPRTTIMTRKRTWYLPPVLWLTSEYIVRDYLRHMTWSWQTDNYQDQYHKENKMMPVHDLAFQFLCQARLDQGYHLVSPRPDSTHFYQEIYLPSRDGSHRILCAIQYFIWKDSATGKITTELWMEPSGNLEQYELVKEWTLEPDRRTISQLVTFDQMHIVGRSKSKGDIKERRRGSENTLDDTMAMMLPQLFDVATVLRSNAFVVATFACPQFHLQEPLATDYFYQLAQSPSSAKKRRSGRLGQHHLIVDSNIECDDLRGARNMCVRPDPVLNRNKENMARLDVRYQSFALMHYFIEYALARIADGEVIMTSQNSGKGFWLKIQEAVMEKLQGKGYLSSSCLTTDLRQLRCFIHIFDVRSFVIVLFPAIDAITTSLLNMDKEESTLPFSEPETQDYRIDVMLFECVRQKPMKPLKTTEYAKALPIVSHTNIKLEEDDDIIVKSVDYIVDEKENFGVPMQPMMLEGQFRRRCARNLSERTVTVAHKVSQLYSKAYFRSLYTCLLRGHAVTDDDLGKALELCEEAKMEIDITEFVNVMSLQQHGDQAG